jgi:hypothetical protein
LTLADLIYEGNETVIATIASVRWSGTTIGTPDSATVTITDEQSVPTVTLTGTTAIAENAAGVATYSYSFYIQSYFSELRIYWNRYFGTDYVASSMTISIPAGDLTRTVTIDHS